MINSIVIKEVGELDVPAPETWMRPLAEAIHRLAQGNARARIGGRFGAEMARTVKTDFTGPKTEAEVYCDSYIAEHVHEGGEIRSKTPGKKLAIPIHALTRRTGEWPREMQDLIAVRRGRNTFLARPSGKGKNAKLEFLFVLKDKVTQKPRPWWPDDGELKGAADAFFSDNF